MIAALDAEWIKLRSLTATVWLLIGAVALTVGVSVAVAAATHQSPGSGGGQDPTKLALAGIDLGQAVIGVLAVLTISEEYGTGMIRTTLTAIPSRPALLGAKAVNVAGLALVAGALGVAGCLLAGRLLLPAAGWAPPTGTRSCPSAAVRPCVPRSAACSTSC
jgi:ABC-2 type transport system permease protein